MIKIVKFTPTATVNSAKPNDVIRFNLQSNGFFDPYSAYLKIVVTVPVDDLVIQASSVQVEDGGRFTVRSSQFKARCLDRSAHSIIGRLVIRSQGQEIERIEQYDVMAAMINDMIYSFEQKQLHHFEGFPCRKVNISGFIDNDISASDTEINDESGQRAKFGINQQQVFYPSAQDQMAQLDQGFFRSKLYKNNAELNLPHSIDGLAYFTNNDGLFVNRNDDGAFPNQDAGHTLFSGGTRTFCIPLYSGILGVMQQDKKLLPLSLMPLEVEFTINPYAFYDVYDSEGVGAVPNTNPRSYTVETFHLYAHVLFFEQELHRSLEAVTAESGIFIHFNTMYLAPVTTHSGTVVQKYAQINVHSKSINAVHFVFVYSGFETDPRKRKLHFVNHNLSQLQLRNGTDLMPSEPIFGDQRNKASGAHTQFLLETFKAYNKLHDPATDSAITWFNYVTDFAPIVQTNYQKWIQQCSTLGRCQYAISLEGEELGMDKTIITGRRGLIPFDINMDSNGKTVDLVSYQFTFVRQDNVVYVRPDLVVEVLGM